MFHLFVPSEAEAEAEVPSEAEKNEENEWKKKNADLIFLSHIQEPLEDTTEISDEEKINTYVFNFGDLVKYGETVGRVVSGDGETYTVETSDGPNTKINIKEMFLTTEGEQKAQIGKKLRNFQAKIDEKKVELIEIKRLVRIEIARKKLKAADDDYKSRYRGYRQESWNARSKILMRLLKAFKQDNLGDDELDEDATVLKILKNFDVIDLEKLKVKQGALERGIDQLERQLTPQKQYLNSLKGVKSMVEPNKLLLEYEGDHPILWMWRKCYDLTFDDMKWKKRPGEVREEKKLLNEYFQKNFEKDVNKVLYEKYNYYTKKMESTNLYKQYNSGTTDEVNALFIKVSKRLETKRMIIMSQIKAANDEVGFIINCLEYFALFQFCELYQRKLREIKILEKYTGETEKTIEV